MNRHLSRRRRTSLVSSAAMAVSATLVGSALPGSSARATLTLNLRLASGATSEYIGGDQTNTDIPIQVWATVTGTQAVNPVPVAGNYASNPQVTSGSGDYFDGLQYLYYNVLNSNSTGTYIAGGIDTATGEGPTLNSTLGFNANGSQAGAVANVVGGVSVGSTSSITIVAKPRAAHAVFDNYVIYNQSGGVYQELGNDGTNIIVSGNTVSFLVETINFKPTAYSATTSTTFTLASPSAAFTASAGGDLSPANWFENITNQTGGTNGQPSGGTNANGSPTIGTSVTIQDTLAGDANLDGSVGPADFLMLRKNYNVVSTGGTWAEGDFNHDGAVGPADFLLLRANYNKTTPAPGATATVANAATATATSVKSAALVVSPLSTGSVGTNVVTTSPQTPPSGEVELVVYTGNGDAQLVFNNASLSLYDITSASGELVPANWKPLSGQTGYSQYGYFSFPPSTNGLSESTFSSGVTLTSGTIDLGNIFSLNVAAASRDLVFQEGDNSDNLYTPDVDYINASSAPEPTSLVLCGAACAGLLGRRRRGPVDPIRT